jgi:uncharacterized protein (DUF58 family)
VTPRRLAPDPIAAPARSVRRVPLAPTGRAALLFFAGVLWLVPAFTDPRAVWVMIAWNLLVAAVIAIDAVRLPRPAALTVTRRWDGPLTLGVPVNVSLDLTNRGTVPIVAKLTDYLSPSLRLDLVVLEGLRAVPGATATARSEIVPRERGDLAAGEVLVEWRSPWGLAERWAQAPVEQAVRVYPNLHEGRRHSMYLIRSRQVALERRRVRRAVGGREFDRLREYRHGDERRDISWIASARRARLVSRVYQPERSQTVWLLIDAGRLLRAKTGGQTLLDRATTAAFAIAQVAMTSGDNVGLVAYGRRVQHRLAPGRGAAHMRRLIEALALVRGEPLEADHAAAAAAMRGGQKRRALVVWLTEVAETAGLPDVIEQAMSLIPRHVVLFAAMRQPEVAAVAAMAPSTTSDMYRVLSAQEAVDRREALLRGLRHRGALILESTPEGLSGGLVDRYLEVKERGLI